MITENTYTSLLLLSGLNASLIGLIDVITLLQSSKIPHCLVIKNERICVPRKSAFKVSKEIHDKCFN